MGGCPCKLLNPQHLASLFVRSTSSFFFAWPNHSVSSFVFWSPYLPKGGRSTLLLTIKKALQIFGPFLFVSKCTDGQQDFTNLRDTPGFPIRDLLKLLLKLT